METIWPVVKTVWFPVLLYTGFQTVILFVVGSGSATKMKASFRRQLAWALAAVILVSLIGAFNRAGTWPLIFGGVLLGLWLLSHYLAHLVAVLIARTKR